jgi:ribosome maturation factor RimP
MTKGDRARTPTTTDASALQAEIEARLTAVEPEVEVLLVEQTTQGRSPTLRVFLDRPGGVDHDLCARATHHLRDLLREYSIEVSSPGPSRPLTKPAHFNRFLGRRVRIRTREPIEGKKDFKGELIGADERSVALAGDWGSITIPHDRIRRSNLVPEPPEQTGEGERGARRTHGEHRRAR